MDRCWATLRSSWALEVDVYEALDDLIHQINTREDQNTKSLYPIAATLKPRLEQKFDTTRDLKWSACHDLISALVKCFWQKTAALAKVVMSKDFLTKVTNSDVRICGIPSAETAILNVSQRKTEDKEFMPPTLWDLLTEHLTFVCADSPLFLFRMFSLNSLTRVACSTISASNNRFACQEKIFPPFSICLIGGF